MKEIDIASFAENLLNEEVAKGKPVQFAPAQAPNAPDISDIEVTRDFAAQVLSEGKWTDSEIDSTKTKAPVERVDEEEIYRASLIESYKKKLSELEDIVQEMTTVGMLGVGAGASPTVLSVNKRRKKKKKKKKRNVKASRFLRRG